MDGDKITRPRELMEIQPDKPFWEGIYVGIKSHDFHSESPCIAAHPPAYSSATDNADPAAPEHTTGKQLTHPCARFDMIKGCRKLSRTSHEKGP
ncbi:MAG: hypothetical protein CVU64_17945 [Deltaproteobacteria bacterium HGW-Deltaproteobacteria-21]|nr:MAG: hypothetical protein CVU64_17945 [Deltaproteobacteria bacterium HGW-Deltaproteobacteria-21]